MRTRWQYTCSYANLFIDAIKAAIIETEDQLVETIWNDLILANTICYELIIINQAQIVFAMVQGSPSRVCQVITKRPSSVP